MPKTTAYNNVPQKTNAEATPMAPKNGAAVGWSDGGIFKSYEPKLNSIWPRAEMRENEF